MTLRINGILVSMGERAARRLEGLDVHPAAGRLSQMRGMTRERLEFEPLIG
jgi:hypothetical protein